MKAWLKGGLIGLLVGFILGWYLKMLIWLLALKLFFSDCHGETCFGFALIFIFIWLFLAPILGAIIFGLICIKPSKKNTKIKPWLKGGLIGIVIFVVISSISNYILFTEGVRDYGLVLVPVQFTIISVISYLLLYFIIGAIIGWIVGKIKSQNKNIK